MNELIPRNVFVLEHNSLNGECVETLVCSLGFQPQKLRRAADLFRDPELHPQAGCLIADFDDFAESSWKLLGTVRNRKPHLAVILVSSQAETQRTVRAMRMGAFSVLERPLDSKQVYEEISLALEQSQSRTTSQTRAAHVRERLGRLNAEEKQVLQMLMDGKPNKVMANQLGVSTRTIENRRRQLYQKMGTFCVPELVRMIVEAEIQ